MATDDLDLAGRPWYLEPWPWIIIGLLGSVILASLATLWIAVANPDGLVVDDESYQQIRRGLRAQDVQDAPDGTGNAGAAPNGEPARRGDGPG